MGQDQFGGNMKKILPTALVLGLALSLTGCSGGGLPSYGSASEIKSKLEAAGYSCDMWFTDPGTPPYKEIANCSASITIQIYEPGTDIPSNLAGGADAENMIYGANWSVNGSLDAPDIANVLGGLQFTP
jgi:hypothetical protein